MNPKSGLGMLKETFKEWQDDDALQLGASLSYYTIFSIAPLLLIVIAVAGLIYGREAVQGQLVGELRGLVGEQGGEAIQTMVANAGLHGSGGVLATVIGVLTILFGATGLFVALQDSLNRIWEVKAKPGQGLKGFIMNRFISFGMILGIGFLLLVSLVLSAAMAALGTWATGLMPGAEVLVKILTFVVAFAVETLLFAMIFKVLPDVKIAWRDVWIGAAVTALLFTLGKFLIGLYIAHSSVASTFGAAGSVVILLLWVYYSSQILFLGAEFTQVYASRYGSRIEPDEHAVPLVVEKREATDPKEWPPAARQKEKGKDEEKGAPERPRDDSRRRTGS
jgi:membrane protein